MYNITLYYQQEKVMERISPIHLKKFVGDLIEDDETRAKVAELLQRYINTVSEDKKELVEGLEMLCPQEDANLNGCECKKPGDECSQKNAKRLIERFGKMPKIVFSN